MPPPSDTSTGWVPQHHRDISLGRFAGFVSKDMFSDANLRANMFKWRGGGACNALEVYSVPPGSVNPKFSDIVGMPFVPCKVGDTFGPGWSTHWFRVTISIPAGVAPRGGPLIFLWDSGSEAMVYVDGQPMQGLTDERNEYILMKEGVPEEDVSMILYVEMACCCVGGNGDGIQPPDPNKSFTLKEVDLAVPNVTVVQLYHDLVAISDVAKTLPADSDTAMQATFIANKVINTCRTDDPSTWEAARKVADEFLSVKGPTRRHQVYAVGHCHIDTAWLWPFSETHRKTARSWSSQLQLMDEFPDHVFTASTGQQYEWLLQDYPDLFARIQARAKEQRFVPIGGSWVEMDANLPCGESLVRQFLYGQRFFEEHFGQRSDVFWLPDTFGYAAQLPQLMMGAGMRYFLTQKLSWNNINTFPHNTFYWEALDGSRVLTHFPPANTYCSKADVNDIVNSMKINRDKDRAPISLLLYGNGDGGGGPTVDMCESLKRLSGGLEGLPYLKVAGPSEFFHDLEAASHDVLKWRGELYFELHRGTYTSHALNKASNRKCELLMREVEMLSTLAKVLDPEGFMYPKSQIDKLWKDILLFQFHDVIPGSAIQAVFDFSKKRYGEMIPELRKLRASAYRSIRRSSYHAAPSQVPAQGAASPEPPPTYVQETQAAGVKPQEEQAAGDKLQEKQAAGFKPQELENSVDSGATFRLALEDVAGGMALVEGPGWRGDASTCLTNSQLLEMSCSSFIHPQHPQQLPQQYPQQHPQQRPQQHPQYQLPPAQPASTAAETKDQGYIFRRTVWGPHVFNSLSFERTEVVAVPLELVPEGVAVKQYSADGTAVLVAVTMPPLSFTPIPFDTLYEGKALPHDEEMGVQLIQLENDPTQFVMSNGLIRAMIDDRGRLLSLRDMKWDRELVPNGTLGNRLRMHEDIPLFWDAWDVEIYHLEKSWVTGPSTCVKILERGPIRAALQVTTQLSETSRIVQTIYQTICSPMLEFETVVEWNENRKMLKVEFPWDLQSDVATYETQFGAVQRPTHQNTSWDWAKFEVCGHRFADLSEPDYGVALLNDSKYGHATHGNVMRLSLLRSPKCPDATTDMGSHTFRYAVFPHSSGWQTGGVVQAALAFNQPPVLQEHVSPWGVDASLLSPAHWLHAEQQLHRLPVGSWIKVEPACPRLSSSSGLIIDTVKVAEDSAGWSPGGGDDGGRDLKVVVRLYEPHGCRGTARLSWDTHRLHVVKVSYCNLLEDEEGEIPFADRDTALAAQPGRGSNHRDHCQGTAHPQVARLAEAQAACPLHATGLKEGGCCSDDHPEAVLIEYTPFKVVSVLVHVKPGVGRVKRPSEEWVLVQSSDSV